MKKVMLEQTMKPQIILCLALVLSGGLFGCSTNSNSTGLKRSPDGYGVNEITSHIFGIEGTVIWIRKTATILKSITVELIKPLPAALGWIPYEKPGEIIVIHFDESLSKLGRLQFATGSIIKVAFGNGIQSINPNDWGSNFSWLYVQENGKFYNAKGEIVESDPDDGENLVPTPKL
jgi:hypothetical protein